MFTFLFGNQGAFNVSYLLTKSLDNVCKLLYVHNLEYFKKHYYSSLKTNLFLSNTNWHREYPERFLPCTSAIANSSFTIRLPSPKGFNLHSLTLHRLCDKKPGIKSELCNKTDHKSDVHPVYPSSCTTIEHKSPQMNVTGRASMRTKFSH